MKRIVLRVSALTAVVVLGVLAIAQAQRSLQSSADPQEVTDADASADAAALGDAALEPVNAAESATSGNDFAQSTSRATARHAESVDDGEIPAAHDALGIAPPSRVVQAGYEEVPTAAGVADPFGPAPTAVIPAELPAAGDQAELADADAHEAATPPPQAFAESAAEPLPATPPASPYAGEPQPADPYAAEPRANSLREPQPAAEPAPSSRYADSEPRYADRSRRSPGHGSAGTARL